MLHCKREFMSWQHTVGRALVPAGSVIDLSADTSARPTACWHERINGIALLTALVFLQLITLLGLYMIHIAWLEMKQAHNLWHQSYLVNMAQNSLREIETKLVDRGPDCIIEKAATAQLLSHSFEWWQARACHCQTKTNTCYYVVESLEKDPCAFIQQTPSMITEYFRITLVCKAEKTKIILQSTIALPYHDELLVCLGPTHFVSIGRQMWRELHKK